MKCKIMALLALVMLSACNVRVDTVSPEQERAARVKAQEFRVQQLNAKAHACDKNDGIKDIPVRYCGRGGCGDTVILCNDGMQRVFPND